MRNRYSVFAPIVVIVMLFAVPGVLLADVTGSILGVVRDPSKAVIKGAQVSVTNTQTNFSEKTLSAEDGSYRFLALPAGTYTLNVTAAGFEQFNDTGIVVKVNDQLRVDVSLTVGSVQQEVSVAAGTVQVETENTQLGDVIDS